ncbi:GNAT family N-acetyltransferase [Haloarculaceae archaeon H-GB2-1]|nr:GNAT family N-acetyltransferase [Haloarculaceae archaeon H-GB1-1]MEA5386183.1 GNAT family N-acetyltransferase [Haloarculaceae archaeon H-GB11]MEA5407689.1 GNAT family N-acetyltransferase [Haloarculaceae archaeon H-GB2-1]
MDIRTAEPADRPAIRDIARRSLEASYSLGPHAIIGAIEEWYEEDRLSETLGDDHCLLLVAEMDGQVVGFSESEYTDSGEGNIWWLHVDPAYRGKGIGSALFDATEQRLHEMGASHLHGRVLADNVEGNAFYEDRDFQKVGEETVEINGRTHTENLYVEADHTGMTEVTLDDGTLVYVSHEEADTGSLDAFHPVYTDEDAGERYGYFCANCETLANAMDAMGRIECDNCGNVRKPTRWDAAYL